MLDKCEMDLDGLVVLAFKNTRVISADVSVSRYGIMIRGGGWSSFGQWSFFPPDRIHLLPSTRTLAPLLALAKAHLPALRGETGARPPTLSEELAIFDGRQVA